ncbi:hypothetical protein EST38_g939 [Candolleomyces aberdarensis]|uniref:Uncharacterized protein n=1 Tax=Candolleomyces aberdarensis TaxID=2316362 RepID=A0A4Q2DYS8_9AGAR|nr:hypothetical protein EST38_g939 [Candolleomyces aberdarensis]
MYIDEAHTLARKGSKDDTRSGTLYDLMIKAAADFSGQAFFIVFLSTTSQLYMLATPAEFINSARAQQGKSTLVPPFTELPFDCHPELKKMIRPGLKLEEIQAFSFIVRFGRPIFWTLYEAIIRDDVDSRTAEDRVRSLAAMKLVAHETTERRHSSIAILAILDMLLNLHYDPRRISTHRVGNTLVASHMRTAFSVPADRFSMYSGYPSEPVLAEAALDVLYLNHKKRNPDSLTNYFESLDEDHLGAIDKGERGENVGKLILLSAYIAAVVEDAKKSGALTENRDGIEREVTPNWRNGCSVSSFLKHLAADQFHSVILECRPDNGSGLALEDAFNKAWVRFTHFVRAGDDSSMTTSVAWGAFVRGMAIIGWHSQPIVDVHIPVLLDKDAPIGEANMSGILVQFKTREVPTPQPKVAIKAEALSYFPPAGSRRDPFRHADADPSSKLSHQTRPYISLVMELGVLSARQAPVRRKIVKILDKLPIVEKPGSKLKAAGSLSKVSTSAPVQSEDNSKEPVHPRYSLFFYGRSHKVYRCLRHSEEVYAKLLQVGGLLEAHSSQRPLKPVLRMKPFWCAGEESFGWLDEPYVKPEDLIVPVPMEMVRAGSDDMDVDEESGPRADPDIEMVQD